MLFDCVQDGLSSGASSFATRPVSFPCRFHPFAFGFLFAKLKDAHAGTGKCGVSWFRLDCSRRFGRQASAAEKPLSL